MEGSKTESSRNWTPLERALPSSLWDDFMHMGEEGTIQKYKHRDTRSYLYIDADCERFYRWVGGAGETKFEETSQACALLHALPGVECAVTATPLVPDPAWLRANNLITVFLDFQSCAVWWVAFDADEGLTILRLLSHIAADMAVLGRIAGLDWDDSEEAFLAVVARIRRMKGCSTCCGSGMFPENCVVRVCRECTGRGYVFHEFPPPMRALIAKRRRERAQAGTVQPT